MRSDTYYALVEEGAYLPSQDDWYGSPEEASEHAENYPDEYESPEVWEITARKVLHGEKAINWERI